MKSKISIKIIAVLIGISALLVGIFIAKYYQSPPEKNQIQIQETPTVTAENSNQSSTKIETAPVEPAVKQPKVSIWKIAWFVGKWALIIVGIIVGFILLLKILVKIFEWVGKDSRSKSSVGLGLLILCGLLSALYFLPRTQALVFNSWDTISNVGAVFSSIKFLALRRIVMTLTFKVA